MRDFFNMDNPLFRALGRLADLMILNIVFIICCIPVITIGASMTAMYYVALKLVDNDDGYILKNFFHSFRQNFKQATGLGLLVLLVSIILGVDLRILSQAEGNLYKAMWVAILVMAILFTLIVNYVFPLLARFENTTRALLKNGLILSIAFLPQSIVLLALTILPIVISLISDSVFVWAILVWILFGFSLFTYLKCIFLNKIFARYIPKEEETDPDHWVVEELPGEGSEDGEAALDDADGKDVSKADSEDTASSEE